MDAVIILFIHNTKHPIIKSEPQFCNSAGIFLLENKELREEDKEKSLYALEDNVVYYFLVLGAAGVPRGHLTWVPWSSGPWYHNHT